MFWPYLNDCACGQHMSHIRATLLFFGAGCAQKNGALATSFGILCGGLAVGGLCVDGRPEHVEKRQNLAQRSWQ
jgi:hypothetical protein